MDLRLPLLASVNLHLGIAEEALLEDAPRTAASELERAEEDLARLRQISPELDGVARGLLAAMVAPLAERAQRIRSALPANPHVVALGAAVEDPEQEQEPL
jgi:hypothetical protein